MKRVLTKILGIIFILVIGYQQSSYADMVVIDPVAEFVDEVFSSPLAFLLGFIGVVILVISAISFFALKSTIKKQTIIKDDKENLTHLHEDEIAKKKNKMQRRFYLCSILLSVSLLIYLVKNDEISLITFFIPIVLFLISIIVRLIENKKVSNILCGISVIFACIIIPLWIGISNKIVNNYNEQFLQYEDEHLWDTIYVHKMYVPHPVSDVEGLINTAIKNNKSGRTVTLVYQNVKYTSIDELKQLLSKLDPNKTYSMAYERDDNYAYIESITLRYYNHK